MNALVTVRKLDVSLGGHPILKGVQTELGRGQITALIGLNGSGKTTFLRALLKEIGYRGEIRFHCGHDHSHPQPQHVGYVPQRLRLEGNFPFTVRDFLAISMSRRPLFLGVSRKLEAEMQRMIAQIGASSTLLDRPMDKISGGEQQRVLLALALEPSPELLLLDEPAAGIDFKDQEGFYQLIARINRERGTTIVLVSHDLSVVSQFAHHVLCLKDGVIQCQGPPTVILQGDALRQTFGSDSAFYAHDHHHHPSPQ